MQEECNALQASIAKIQTIGGKPEEIQKCLKKEAKEGKNVVNSDLEVLRFALIFWALEKHISQVHEGAVLHCNTISAAS